jgi:hypothetical protein
MGFRPVVIGPLLKPVKRSWLHARMGECREFAKTVIVTGGSRGIGFAIAHSLFRRGASVACMLKLEARFKHSITTLV